MTGAGEWPPNPYDYSAPASGQHFAGRGAEKSVLGRYLDGITDATTAHLLMYGRRGIGKTTLLGELERQAQDRGLIVTRVSVDESSCGDRAFFAEVMRGIANSILREGGLGGADGDFAVALEQATLGRAVERGIGPLRVVEFDGATRGHLARVPDALILADIADLVDAAHELDRHGLLLVVDETDQLAPEQATIQRIRNLLILPKTISVVLAGTDAVVSLLDSDASPMGRHFRRLEVPPLADRSETRDLLAKPLRTVGLNPGEVLPYAVVAEVHTLTNGRPFEVALLGHAMYEDAVARDGDELQLNEAVLDAVIGHVRPSPEDEAAIQKIRSLDPEDLRLAARYCVDPKPTLSEHALLRMAFDPLELATVDSVRAEVRSEWVKLTELGLATVDENALITPSFGELSQTYLKYRARRMDVLDEGVEGRFSDRMAGRIQARLTKGLAPLGAAAYFARSHVVIEGGRESEAWKFVSDLRDGRLDDVAASGSSLADATMQYQLETSGDPAGHWALILMPFEVGEDGFSHLLLIESHPDPPPMDRVLSEIGKLFESAIPYGVNLGELDQAVVDDESWRRLGAGRLAHVFADMGEHIWYDGRRSSALSLMQQAYEQIGKVSQFEGPLLEPEVRFANNLGFMEMAEGHLVEAVDSLHRLATRGGLAPERRLLDRTTLLCNLAASCAGTGRYVEAIAWADQCLELRTADGPELTSGVLPVYLPDPEWPHKPRMVMSPDPFQIAAATKASALAAMDDPHSIDFAIEVAEAVGSSWPADVLEAIGLKLRRPDVVTISAEYRRRARDEEASQVDELA